MSLFARSVLPGGTIMIAPNTGVSAGRYARFPKRYRAFALPAGASGARRQTSSESRP